MNFNSKKPIYLQITDYFLNSIISKKYNIGDRILSVRDLAIQLGVNPNTVMRAYTYLQDKNIIFNKRGIGYFISENARENAIDIKYKEFTNDELPEVFDTMKILGISFADLKKLYKKHKTKKSKTHENK